MSFFVKPLHYDAYQNLTRSVSLPTAINMTSIIFLLALKALGVIARPDQVFGQFKVGDQFSLSAHDGLPGLRVFYRDGKDDRIWLSHPAAII
jgi:hypothetical protein